MLPLPPIDLTPSVSTAYDSQGFFIYLFVLRKSTGRANTIMNLTVGEGGCGRALQGQKNENVRSHCLVMNHNASTVSLKLQLQVLKHFETSQTLLLVTLGFNLD